MPKLIIGLGGTGTRVVRRIRERWGTGIPRDVGMAVIDARPKPEDGPIPDVAYSAITNPIRMPYAFAEYEDSVRDWWPRRMQPSEGIDFSDGCGAYRPIGRFFAFRYAGTIVDTIATTLDRLLIKSSFTAGDPAGSFAVFLVGSLGNGTGGGTFMDVGTIVKHQLATMPGRVRCFGVFIPGSVTRRGHQGDDLVAMRVAASGYAALMELQYEFNRHDTTAEPRPLGPYVFRGWTGGYVQEFSPGRTREAAEASLPVDFAHILDRKDRVGRLSEYPTLLNIAAESIAILAEGGDTADRLVDAYAHATGSRRFGSFGAARLTVPAGLILDWATGVHTLATLDVATSRDAERWRGLLADATPKGDEVLKAGDPKLGFESSVDFFLGKVLKVKETGEKGPKGHNDLFDQFMERQDREALDEFERLADELRRLDEPKSIANKAEELQQYVDGKTRDLESRRKRALTDGDGSQWYRQPTSVEHPEDAGTRWLIDARVRRFVEAGAFGVLREWLEELERQLKRNLDSVREYERTEYLSRPQNADLDGSTKLEDLKKRARSIFAPWQRSKLRQGAGSIEQDERTRFNFHLWESKIEAVERFYDLALAHVDKLARAADTAIAWFSEPRMRDPLDDGIRLAAQALDRNIRQEVTTEGLRAEMFIGADEETRDRIAAQLLESLSTAPQAVLEGDPRALFGLFLAKLDSDASGNFLAGGEDPRTVDDTRVIDDFRNGLTARVRRSIEGAVQGFCQIDRVLTAEAQTLLEEYYQRCVVEKDAIDPTGRERVVERIRDTASDGVMDLVTSLPWASDKAKALEQGTELMVAGKLYRIVAFATAQWSIIPSGREEHAVATSVFVNYPQSAARVARGLQQLQNLLGKHYSVTPGPRPYGDQRRIDVVRVELGGRLDTLAMADELPAYRRCLEDEHGGFSPHLTEHYARLGEAHLEDRGLSVAEGPQLLALAELYGYLTADSHGNYKLARSFETRREDGRILFEGMAAGPTVGGRGVDKVVEYLDSDDAMNLRTAFKALIYDELVRDAYGVPGEVDPLGWNGVSSKLSGRAAELRSEATRHGPDGKAALFEKQASALNELAVELEQLAGRERPSLFR